MVCVYMYCMRTCVCLCMCLCKCLSLEDLLVGVVVDLPRVCAKLYVKIDDNVTCYNQEKQLSIFAVLCSQMVVMFLCNNTYGVSEGVDCNVRDDYKVRVYGSKHPHLCVCVCVCVCVV